MKHPDPALKYIYNPQCDDIYLKGDDILEWLKDQLIIQLTDKECECLASDFIKVQLENMTRRFKITKESAREKSKTLGI